VVDLGMQAYASANYAAAAQALARAAHSDSSPGVAFYLGAALLSAGNADSALGPLLRARVPEGNPWAAEATLLAAKVLVRLRQADSALALLDQAIAANPRAAALRAFADSVRKQ
jgi:tetratricopeptide (TPR) repeat protein